VYVVVFESPVQCQIPVWGMTNGLPFL